MTEHLTLHMVVAGDLDRSIGVDAITETFPDASIDLPEEDSILADIGADPMLVDRVEAAFTNARDSVARQILPRTEEKGVPEDMQADVANTLGGQAVYGWIKSMDGAAPGTLVSEVCLTGAETREALINVIESVQHEGKFLTDVYNEIRIDERDGRIVMKNTINGQVTTGFLFETTAELNRLFLEPSVASATISPGDEGQCGTLMDLVHEWP